MIDPNKVTQAVMEFMQNPTWKEIFTNAPGGAMERLAISFYFSKFHDDFKPEDFDEYRALREEYEKSMTEEDLQYLIDNSDKPTAKKHYQELIDKLRQGGGQPTGQLRFEKDGNGGDGGDDGGQQQQEGQEQAPEGTPPPQQEKGTGDEAAPEGQEEGSGEAEQNTQSQGQNQGAEADLAKIREFMGIQ